MRSLRTKFVISTLLVFAAVSGASLLAAHWLLQRSLIDEVARSAVRNEHLLSAAMAPLVAQRDLAAAEELLRLLVEDGSFDYVEIDDPAGRSFARAGQTLPAERPASEAGSVERLQASGGTFHFEGDLELNGRRFGVYRFGIADRPLRIAERNILGGLVAIGLLGLVAAALLQTALARLLTRRLQALADGANRLAAGEGGVALPVQGTDETAQLTVAFNRMAQALEQRVTALQQAERELQRANDELEERVAARTAELATARDVAESANRAKTEFLSRMSHELRTPLNAILGFAQVLRLRLKPAPAGVGEQLGHIETAGWHLLELINDVLDLSRIEAGTMVVSRDAVALAPLLADSVRMVGSVAQAAQVSVFIEPFDESLAAEADATRLRQVMGNLLSNACKYNRPGGQVTVGVQADGDAVSVSVVDTGAGLTTAQQAALFEPFNRLGAERSAVEGTGIGLVITKRLVELMGGRLHVQSTPGSGSTFRVQLRRAALPAAALSGAQVPQAAPAGGRGVTLLYVEDNAANVQLLAEVLRLRPAVHLLAAVDGPQGLALAREHEPDLVVVDVALPGIDGYELCRRLRSLPALRQRPIVALSANAMASDRERGRDAGFDHYFTKPLDVTHFLAWLDQTLSSTASTTRGPG
ncbi:MAG: response regulator [Rubrivivax sp.]|nr:response regulator [Rubrivivax sp.]